MKVPGMDSVVPWNAYQRGGNEEREIVARQHPHNSNSPESKAPANNGNGAPQDSAWTKVCMDVVGTSQLIMGKLQEAIGIVLHKDGMEQSGLKRKQIGAEKRSRAHRDDTANADDVTWATAPAIVNGRHAHKANSE